MYIYIYTHVYTSKKPTLLYVTAVNIKKSHIFPYRYISELYSFVNKYSFINNDGVRNNYVTTYEIHAYAIIRETFH